MFLREELERIYRERRALIPQDVVDEARPPDSPLHSQFEWDDRIAGEKYRVDQARTLIRKVTITRIDDNGERLNLRAFHSVQLAEGSESGRTRTYMPIEDIANDPVSMASLLREMQRDWAIMKARYKGMQEFWEMLAADLPAEEAA